MFPPAATMPTSSEPGCTSRPSSVNTLVVGLGRNSAVVAALSWVATWVAIAPSLEFMMSNSDDVRAAGRAGPA